MMYGYQLLRKVADVFEAEPDLYTQNDWWKGKFIDGDCGTKGCIAGHICNEAVKISQLPVSIGGSASINAQILLGEGKEYDEMFSGSFEPVNGIVSFLRDLADLAEYIQNHGQPPEGHVWINEFITENNKSANIPL